MRLDPRMIVELLQQMERQYAEHRPHLADVAMALSRSDFERAVEATGSLQDALESIIVTRARLKDYVIAADGLGEPESLIELSIRCRRVVIAMQSGRLRDAFQGAGASGRAPGWFVGKLQGIEDVVLRLEELGRSSCAWERYRRDQALPLGMTDADRAMMYRTTVRIAQRTMRELGSDPDLVHFLRRGMAAADWRDVHIGCTQVASALAGDIEGESDSDITTQPSCSGKASAHAETR